MTGPITAAFLGGPADGKTQALPGLVDVYRFAVVPDLPPWAESAPEPLKAAKYELVRAPDGRASIDDDGRYRYRWAGESTW